VLEPIHGTLVPHHRRRRRRFALVLALLVGLGGAATAAPWSTAAATAPISPLTDEEEAFVEGATALTDLTAAEAIDIFRHHPELADAIPVAVTDVTYRFAPSPARHESVSSSRLPVPLQWCRVWTRRKIRNRLGMVLFSFKMTQDWNYNYTRVWPRTPLTSYDVTDWGHWLGGWYYDGIVEAGGRYRGLAGVSPFAIHRSWRTGQFRTADVAGGITVNVPLFIEKLYNGDWVSTTKFGLPGCNTA
jgi:hypothetical protein